MDELILKEMRDELSRYCAVPESEWQKVARMIKPLRIRKNEHFINIGEVADKLGFIKSGIFRVYYVTDDGDEKILVFRNENHFLTAFSAFLNGTPSWYAIQALEDSVLLCFTLKEYTRIMANDSCWNTLTRKYVENLFIEKEQRERGFLSENAMTRYITFQQSYPGIEGRIPQYYIASYLGITPVALSRIRKKMGKKSTP
ncbi:MAG: Crp/Fnr family transcriptional regulator [Spirochaetes bacterium]|nr:MAG: Crp/Fnr family transcriptional regulator [Spirochaetota bacterium]